MQICIYRSIGGKQLLNLYISLDLFFFFLRLLSVESINDKETETAPQLGGKARIYNAICIIKYTNKFYLFS